MWTMCFMPQVRENSDCVRRFQRYRRVRTRALRVPSRGGAHGARFGPEAVRKTCFVA